MEEEKKVKPLSQAELDRLLKVLFPWGYAKVGETRYIGPVPSRGTYNIMGLETSENYGETGSVFSLIIIKVTDDDIETKDLLGFYLGVMAYAFPEFISDNKNFEESGCDVLDFKRRDHEHYDSWFVFWLESKRGLTMPIDETQQ